MKFGICTAVTNAGLAREAGADFVEENIQGFLVPGERADGFAPKLAAAQASPLPVTAANCFLPGSLKCTGPAVDLPAILQWAETVFDRARQVGIEILVFGSGGSRQVPAGFSGATAFEQFVALLRQLGPLAAPHSVTLVIEPLNTGECNLINTVAEGAEAMARANHPQIGLLADLYHMARNGESPEDLRRFGSQLAHVHVAEKENRTAPSVAGDDFRAYFRALKRAGYDQRISIESGWTDLPSQIGPAFQVLRQQWDSAPA